MKPLVIFIYLFPTVSGTLTQMYRKSLWLMEHGFSVILFTGFRTEMDALFVRSGVKVKYFYFPVFERRWKVNYVDKVVDQMEKVLVRENVLSQLKFIDTANPVAALISEAASLRWGCPAVTGLFHPTYYSPESYAIRSWHKLLLNLFDRNSIYSMNEECLQSTVAIYNLQPRVIPIFPLIMNQSEFLYKSNGDSHRVLSLGRLDPFKTYNLYMIDIIAELIRDFPDVHYTIIGSGALQKQMLDKINQFGLERHITLVSSWPYDRLWELANKFDINVGMGYSIIDLAAYGLPSLAAIAFDETRITAGYVHQLRKYTVGEDPGEHPEKMLSKLREFLNKSAPDREAIAMNDYQYVGRIFNANEIMPRFVEFALSAQPAETQTKTLAVSDSRQPGLFDYYIWLMRSYAFPMWNLIQKTVNLARIKV